ncbi:MAG: 4Fe-4S dicluster domain-containing protein [Gallionellaceae bacterium]|jgi:molybdopterin-containing oxidoreductase family iron-sulfur binding subunit|nr:4Fe-4S dicluster domain-containing protein [Gallionellaceae bacterium]
MSVSNLLENWSKYRHTHPLDDGGHADWNAYPSPIKWAMSIDLDACTGCNACSVACYAENNLPVVGKDKYAHGQAMHWMRIERYWGEPEKAIDEFDSAMNFQLVAQNFDVDQGAQFLPMLCQQCEAAPCETVCPVGATNHTEDGLNSQIYNRCIGSRYCSANCPYKVRYFNWYSYPDQEHAWPEPLNQQLNPDLTVRTKGVMEKCTFCKQRTYTARNDAKTEGREIRDEDVQTACQQACPTGAISFGNLFNPESTVAKQWSAQQVDLVKEKQDKDGTPDNKLRGYRILEELRPFPSIMYLERVRESAV